MRTLIFNVNKQIIEPDSICDFSGLIPGSEKYLQASFIFSPEWDGCKKVATFYSMLGREYPPQELKDGRTCVIPAEALKKRAFKVQVMGGKKDFRITTNKLIVKQDGGDA